MHIGVHRMRKLSYRGASTSHGGVIVSGVYHNVDVHVGGVLQQASLDGDVHVCPIPGHGINNVIGTGFANFDGIPHTLVGDLCTCGATVVGESDNTYSD